MKILCMVAAAFLVTATAAAADEPEADQAQQDKKVCRSQKMTGSLTRVRRVCMTQRQWTEMAENTNRALDRMGRSANQAQAQNAQNGIVGAAGGGPQ